MSKDPQDILEEAEVERCYQMTQDAYDEACKIVGYTNQEVRVKHVLGQISYNEANDAFEKLDEVYRGLICKFPTDMLIAILESNERRKNGEEGVHRAQKTIDSIHTELLERQLYEEKGYT